jgi:MFS family permease
MWQSRLLLSAVVVVGAGQTLVFAIVPTTARAIGLSEVQSSLIFSISAVAGLVANPLWGRASDRIGRLPVVVFGLVTYGILLALLAGLLEAGLRGRFLAYVLGGMLLIRGLHGALTTGVLPATQAHLADRSTSAERVGGMASVTIAFGLGSLIGPAVVALLAPFGLLSGLWFFSAVAVGLAVVVFAMARRQAAVLPARKREAGRLTLTAILVCCLVMNGLFHIVFIGSMQLVGFVIQDRFQQTPANAVALASYTLLAMAATTIAAQAALVLFKTDRVRLLAALGFLAGCLAYGLATIPLPPTLAAATPVLIGLLLALVMPAISAIVSHLAGPAAYGAAMGAVGATQALGFLLGPLAASWLYAMDRTAPLYAALAALLLCLAATPLLPGRLK